MADEAHQTGPQDCGPEALAAHCRALASRMEVRVDAMLERDGSPEAATTGRGIGISFRFACELVGALKGAAEAWEKVK